MKRIACIGVAIALSTILLSSFAATQTAAQPTAQPSAAPVCPLEMKCSSPVVVSQTLSV